MGWVAWVTYTVVYAAHDDSPRATRPGAGTILCRSSLRNGPEPISPLTPDPWPARRRPPLGDALAHSVEAALRLKINNANLDAGQYQIDQVETVPAEPVSTQSYLNSASGLCLDDPNGSTAPSTFADVEACGAGTQQQFTYTRLRSGTPCSSLTAGALGYRSNARNPSAPGRACARAARSGCGRGPAGRRGSRRCSGPPPSGRRSTNTSVSAGSHCVVGASMVSAGVMWI